MLTISSNLKPFLNEATGFRFATCWKIVPESGTTFYFTDCNTAITFDGNTYLPAHGVSASAREKMNSLASRNLNLRGVIDSSYIDEADIHAGLWDNAKVTEYTVDWRYPFAGAIATAVYWLTATEYGDEFWTGEIEGVVQKLRRNKGRNFGKLCHNELGDANCTVVISSFQSSGAVASGVTRASFTSTTAAVIAKADDYYNEGKVTFTSGSNNGLARPIRDFVVSGGTATVRCHIAFPYDIAAADTFDLDIGCGKETEDCKGTAGTKGKPWTNNIANHGGFPFIPGDDAIILTPDAK